jgi:hypothetical protein
MDRAINEHENLYRKKYKAMTMFEKGKVQESFVKMLREEKDNEKRI